MANQKLKELIVPGSSDVYDIDAKYIKGSTPETFINNNIKESYLQWGGKNFTASFGPIDAAMIDTLGANRFAFANSAGITLEYTRDGGTTWTVLDDDVLKKRLFSTGVGNFHVGNSSATYEDKTAFKCRITMRTSNSYANVYSALNKFAIYVSTNGSQGCRCLIEGRKEANREAGSNVWDTFANAPIDGWSGWNIINTPTITTHGNNNSQYSELRFTFSVTTHPSTNKYAGLSVLQICAFGGVGWTTPSNMAKTGHLYSYDQNQTATFPGGVVAPYFTGNASSASKFSSKRNVTLTGDVVGSASSDGASGWTVATTISAISEDDINALFD